MVNGYGSVALNAMGGHTQRTPGQRFISPVNAGAQMTPARMRQAQQSATARVKQMRRDPARIGGSHPTRPMTQKVTMGATRNKPVAAAIKESAPDIIKKQPIMKSFMSGKGLAIGAGAAVIAGLAMNRRGDGTSSGRSGMTRY
jgi:hypothetical protein